MTDSIFIMMILIHFLADFGLQTHDQATNKSISNKWLFYHVGVYSLIWFLAAFMLNDDWIKVLFFALVTFSCHFITDWLTSRIGKPFWEKKNLHDGFVVVGFDQVLHMIQLWLCIKYILL
mgnify:CR=1 FL=1